MSVHFLYFLSEWKGVKTISSLIKYVENEICNSTSDKKRPREEQKHNPTSKTFLKLLKSFTSYTSY